MRRTFLAVGTVALLVATGCASGRAAWTAAPAAAGGPSEVTTALAIAEPATPAPVVSQAEGEVIGELEFHAFDLRFEPMNATVDAPGRYRVTLVNEGAILHDVTFDDGTVLSAEAGQTVSGEVVVPAEGIGFNCSIPGHAQAGMTGTISVAGGATETAAPASHDPGSHGGPAPDTGIEPDPDAPPPILYDATAPARL
jgi:nitrite reductase (NO-forming)